VTRTGPSRPGDASFAAGRLESARAFHDAARDVAALAGEGANANPIVSQLVNAAIAYADALTATFSGRVNQRDHAVECVKFCKLPVATGLTDGIMRLGGAAASCAP
jgi:hypothetical protein